MTQLRVSEIFYSLQGESLSAGLPTTFIRLTGCPLRCHYCDTQYAYQGGENVDIDAIIEKVKQYQTQYVTVTGGEPLIQKHCLTLLTQLCDNHFMVSLETSGACSVQAVDPRVTKVIDLKTPGSGETEKNDFNNLQYLNQQDQIKFVICSRQDYEWSRQIIDQYQINQQCHILMSPVVPQQNPTQLAEWILADQITVRFQMQLHKLLWGDVPGK